MPEEINRILIDHLSSLLFAPTSTSVLNLKKEGITNGVHFTGDTMLDSFLKYKSLIDSKYAWETFDLEPKEYHLLTVHREENTNIKDNLVQIIDAITSMDQNILFPIHPRTRRKLVEYRLLKKLKGAKNIITCDPLGYFTFLSVLSQAKVVLTDSGGIQKQAFFYEVPCITLWSCQIGWIETLKNGWNRVVSPDEQSILEALSNLFDDWPKERPDITVFGDGHASQKIVTFLLNCIANESKNRQRAFDNM
jgi:UDP-N-acetylglucosamine 2-epimerase